MNTRKYRITEHLASSNRQISSGMGFTLLITPSSACLPHKTRLTAEWIRAVVGRSLSLGNTYDGFLTDQVWR